MVVASSSALRLLALLCIFVFPLCHVYAFQFLPVNTNTCMNRPYCTPSTKATALFLASSGSTDKTNSAVNGVPFFATLEPADNVGSTVTVTTRLPLGAIFDSSREYIFSTATNVRGYEWTLKETDELFDDLTDVAGVSSTLASDGSSVSLQPKQDYELSQVVLVPMEWDRAVYGLGQKYDVHDGQQRIVTLCLLFAALRESFREHSNIDDESLLTDTVEELTNMLNPPKVRKEPVLRIELRKRDNDMLRRILVPELVHDGIVEENTGAVRVNLPPPDQRKTLSVANRRVVENYELLLDRVTNGLTKDERLALLDYTVEHVYLLVCVPETARIARNIVMAQGKGMDNEPIDDFKGLVCFRYTLEEDEMYRTFDKWDDLAATPDIETYAVGRGIVASACLLRAATALKIKIRKNDEINAMERWLRQDLVQNSYEGKDFFTRNIEPASLVLGRFREGTFDSFIKGASGGKLEKTIAARLKFLRALTSTVSSTKEVEMVVVDLLLQPDLTNTQLDQFLHAVELLAMWMALQMPSPLQRHKRCFDLLDAINGGDDCSKVIEVAVPQEELSVLRSSLSSFEFGATATGKKIAIAVLERLNVYYLLTDEGGGKVEIPEGEQRLEYVLPKTSTGKYWKEHWPDQDERTQCTYLLGNLALLSGKATARQANRNFDEKKKRYEKELWPLTSILAEWTLWNRDAQTEQQEWVLGLIDKMWGL